jgi:hypothetical protein
MRRPRLARPEPITQRPAKGMKIAKAKAGSRKLNRCNPNCQNVMKSRSGCSEHAFKVRHILKLCMQNHVY